MNVELRELNCPNCGAPLQCRADHPIATCPFCESRIAAQWEELGRKVALDGIAVQAVPFGVSAQDFENALLAWLAAGEMTPDDVLTQAMVREHVGLFVPAYRYWGSWSATWTAQAGFRRTETYVENTTKLVDGRHVTVPETRTRTVTDWRPWNGTTDGDYDLMVLASEKVPKELRAFCEARTKEDRSDLVPFTPDLIEGYVAETPSSPADEVWEGPGLAKLNAHATAVITGTIHADEVRNVAYAPDIVPRGSARVLLPYWLLSYEYGGQTFHVIWDGADVARHQGKRPVDRERQARVKALYAPAWKWGFIWGIVTLIGLILFVLPGLITLAIGIIHVLKLVETANEEKRAIVEASQQRRQALLERVQVEGGGIADAI